MVNERNLQRLRLEFQDIKRELVLPSLHLHKQQPAEDSLLLQYLIDHLQVPLDECLLGVAASKQKLDVVRIVLAVLIALAVFDDLVDDGLEEGYIYHPAQTGLFIVQQGQHSYLPHL